MAKKQAPEPHDLDPLKRSHRYSRLAKDAERVLKYLDCIAMLQTSEGSRIDREGYMVEGLKTAAVVVYARCFLSSWSDGQAARSADFSELECSQDPMLLAMHTHIMDLRNEAVAHAGWLYHHTALVAFPDLPGTLRVSSGRSGVEAISEYTFSLLATRVLQDAERLERKYATQGVQPSDPPYQP